MLFPAGSIPAGPKVDAQKALLLVDFQNDFVTPTGKLPVDNVYSFLPKLPTLVAKFRSQGTIVWTRTEFKKARPAVSSKTGSYSILLRQFLQEKDNEDDPEVSFLSSPGRSQGTETSYQQQLPQPNTGQDPEAFLSMRSSTAIPRPCLAGTIGAGMPRKLASATDLSKDISIVKSDYSAFLDTTLLDQLRTRLITHLYVYGSLSNISVYATVLDAVMHGLEVTLIEDCLGYRDYECYEEAKRQMAGTFGTTGIDYQELMDDLAGLLGDVVHEADLGTTFQLGFMHVPKPSRRSHSPRPSQKHIHTSPPKGACSKTRRSEPPADVRRSYANVLPPQDFIEPDTDDTPPQTGTSRPSSKQGTPDPTQPRKRSTSDLDDTVVDVPKFSPLLSTRLPPPSLSSTQYKTNRPRVRRPRNSHESSNRPVTSSTLRSLRPATITGKMTDSDSDTTNHAVASPKPERVAKRKKTSKKAVTTLGPSDTIGSGDCHLITDLLLSPEAITLFTTLKSTTTWQKMYQRGGEVPRLVAVQGDTTTHAPSIPIYRHPTDTTLPLLPFTAAVNTLRLAAEAHVKHPLNHVLIQRYRTGEDNISEHADKTLDIVRGSSIVNVSLGAQRTMTLRTKRSAGATAISPDQPSERTTQRIPLPHNSLFVLGEETNRYWLHSIRAEKRLQSERSDAEKAFGGERISLTFRQIGTWVDESEGVIWGQGATSESWKGATKILEGEEARREGERMITAFGRENHESTEWNWEKVYGQGFDVVDWEREDRDLG